MYTALPIYKLRNIRNLYKDGSKFNKDLVYGH